MARTLVEKQDVIDRALDVIEPASQTPPVTPARDRAATESMSRSKIAQEAEKLTSEQITAIGTSLRMLAGMCDAAQAIDGHGFNKLDTAIGKALAGSRLTRRQAVLGLKLANKYRHQLPPDLVALAKGGEAA